MKTRPVVPRPIPVVLALGCAFLTGNGRPGHAADAQAAARPPAAQTTPAPKPAQPARPARAARPSLQIEVTDPGGAPLEGVQVRSVGPVDREGATNASGQVSFTNLRQGTYRVRFEKEGYVILERDTTLPAATRATRLDVALTPAPELPPPPPPPAAPPPPPPAPPRPVGEARNVNVPDFTEKNFIGRNDPQKFSTLGCTGYATTRLLQLREPLADRLHDDADETFYVVAGEAAVRILDRDWGLQPGSLLVVPRGTKHTITRRGRNPAILVSVLSGPPCTPEGSGQ
jgi:mannose-6-phosphate isomerase-like protein (cupin superfamily)